MKHGTLTSCLWLLLLAPLGEKVAKAEGGCALLDKRTPAQSITFERIDGGASAKRVLERVVLRLRNNTNCDVFLHVFDPSLSTRYALSDGFPDGMWLDSLKYDLEVQESLPPAKKRVYVDEAYSELRLFAGRSVTFSVPLDRFDRWVRVEVPFRYEWDTWGVPDHLAFFGNLHLPDEVLRRTAVCRQVEGCQPTRSNNGMNRTRNQRGSHP